MRNGKIIEENNPIALLANYNENASFIHFAIFYFYIWIWNKVLEDVFYKICREDDEAKEKNLPIMDEEKIVSKFLFKAKLGHFFNN